MSIFFSHGIGKFESSAVFSYKSGSNNLRLTFSSDLSVSSTGFHATWKAVRRHNLRTDLGHKNFYKNDTGIFCKNKTIEENLGWIESLGYGVSRDVEGIKFEESFKVDCWMSVVAPGKELTKLFLVMKYSSSIYIKPFKKGKNRFFK